MNGKKMHLRKKDFLIFADECGLSRVSAEKMITGITEKKRHIYDKMRRISASEASETEFALAHR